MAAVSPTDVEAAPGADVRAERLPSGPAVGLSLEKTKSFAKGAVSLVKSATFDKVMKKKLKNKTGTEVKRGLIKPDNSRWENFKAFWNGPYFLIIPPAYEEYARKIFNTTNPKASAPVTPRTPNGPGGKPTEGKAIDDQHAEDESFEYPDFLSKMKSVVVKDWKAKRAHQGDKRYAIAPEDLVPLPFDAPKLHGLLSEFVVTVFLIVQSTVVMFLAIMVENQDRKYKDSGNYTSTWQPLIKAIVIIYPLITLFIMLVQALEVTIKKFMYYRLLSMRVLTDWENVMVWQGSFFYYFVATWIMLNVWAIYGLAAYYGQNGNTGADPTSLSTFIVVNLQTMQLLIQYYRVMTAEQRLVSLNEIFERAPVEAQNLLQYTYIVEEEDIINECYRFMKKQWRRLLRRIAYLCCCTCMFRDWAKQSKAVRWNVYRLHKKAGNAEVLRAETYRLLMKTFEEEKDEASLKELLKEMDADGIPAVPHTDEPVVAPTEVQLEEKKSANGVSNGGANGAPEPLEIDRPTAHSNTAPWDMDDSETEQEEETESPKCCSGGWWRKKWRGFWWGFYIRLYASIHSVLVAFLPGTNSWPFRPDKPYFRFITGIQLVGSCLCCLMILFGVLGATNQSPCNKGNKACDQCFRYVDTYLVTNSSGYLELQNKGLTCEANFNISQSAMSAIGATVGNMLGCFGNATNTTGL
ncbi:hypothetical protein HYH02_007942 [Chlamydomonas schloesseri]|uniref:Uncharacterized protein n=1 Tax=Chlamydomonas schloesseri TaxID=2026947 RepID=A0A836B465_9CHLO|nr:hypothetical protein HYH02_007942 [Chlamydomonas schloesseri]|eukprot:KAG2447201.1 hypothetical protein HYH02_007942 [Chlamydomonas schloesseri]